MQQVLAIKLVMVEWCLYFFLVPYFHLAVHWCSLNQNLSALHKRTEIWRADDAISIVNFLSMHISIFLCSQIFWTRILTPPRMNVKCISLCKHRRPGYTAFTLMPQHNMGYAGSPKIRQFTVWYACREHRWTRSNIREWVGLPSLGEGCQFFLPRGLTPPLNSTQKFCLQHSPF